MIPFQNTYAHLPPRFFAKQSPAPVPAPLLIRVNRELAESLAIDPDWAESAEGLASWSGNRVPEGAEPIAQAYAGHQFGGFSPQLGDGRALLLGEVLTREGERRDLQLKGSGRTPFSRGGDGKSALGPVLREYIVSEAMAALGVPTTRALAAVCSGESVHRQEGPVPGGVFTRVAASHIRVGTFQYFLAQQDHGALRILADYVIARHYPQAAEATNPALALLEEVISAQARLIPHWMSLGFIHGVMNTDNCAVSGETIDYGPCAFMEAFHPQCVFSSIDRNARYAWGNQPNIGLWNLTRFAETLIPLIADDPEVAKAVAEDALGKYSAQLGAHYHTRFRAKLGLPGVASEDFIRTTLEQIAEQQVDFTLFFRRLTQVAQGGTNAELRELFSDHESFENWFSLWQKEHDPADGPTAMSAANPIRIPRNHRIEQAIQAGNEGDFTLFHQLVDGLAEPFSENSDFAELEALPTPEEVVHETFCGT